MNRPIDGIDQDGLEWAPTPQQEKAAKAKAAINAIKSITPQSQQAAASNLPPPSGNATLSQGATPGTWAANESARLRQQHEYNKEMEARRDLDPVAFGVVRSTFSASNQFVKNVGEHGYGIYEGIEEKNGWKIAGNTALLALDLSPFLVKGSSSALSVTMGISRNEGASLATAAKVGAPYYSEWANLGIYNPNNFQGWGSAFKFVTDKVIASGGKIHFELKGLNIPEALAGDANIWVGRYTAWELQQVTRSATLFKNTTFYINGVKQTAKQLTELGIKAP